MLNSIRECLEFLVCPMCQSGTLYFIEKGKCLECPKCKEKFPILLDRIIDFRLPILLHDSSDTIEKLLLENYDKSYFDLIDIKYNVTTSNKNLRKKYIEVSRNLHIRNKEKAQIVRGLIGNRNLLKVLELGCGSGAIIHEIRKTSELVVGLDLSLSQLILASKVLDEMGANNVLLLCASVEAMPITKNCFDLIFASDVIEHVPNRFSFVKLGVDLLCPGGEFIFNSPNRYTLFSPEPHTNVWFFGFVPRKYMGKYIQFRAGVRYIDIYILSLIELKRIVKEISQTAKIYGLLKEELVGASKNKLKCTVLKMFPFGPFMLNCVFRYFLPSYTVVIKKDK